MLKAEGEEMNEDKGRKEPEYVPRFFLYPFSVVLLAPFS
jgi:hypothetical protein